MKKTTKTTIADVRVSQVCRTKEDVVVPVEHITSSGRPAMKCRIIGKVINGRTIYMPSVELLVLPINTEVVTL